MNPSVTFETKCWEGDWEFLLRTGRIERMVERSRFKFAKKTLIINNVEAPERVAAYAQRLVDRGVLTDYRIVREHEADALDFFGLSRDALGAGYVYSIAELVGIYVCRTDFLLHYSGDSAPAEATPWIEAALDRFATDARVKVANLTWNRNYAEAASESFSEDADFYSGYGFSDQMYLVRVADFRNAAVYHDTNPVSERYPGYGGELFEKRVDSWMRNHEFHRITYRHGSYIHRNFPKAGLRRRIALLMERAGIAKI
jgi:hypothetical protein